MCWIFLLRSRADNKNKLWNIKRISNWDRLTKRITTSSRELMMDRARKKRMLLIWCRWKKTILIPICSISRRRRLKFTTKAKNKSITIMINSSWLSYSPKDNINYKKQRNTKQHGNLVYWKNKVKNHHQNNTSPPKTKYSQSTRLKKTVSSC